MNSFESLHILGRAKVLGPYIYSWTMRLDPFLHKEVFDLKSNQICHPGFRHRFDGSGGLRPL